MQTNFVDFRELVDAINEIQNNLTKNRVVSKSSDENEVLQDLAGQVLWLQNEVEALKEQNKLLQELILVKRTNEKELEPEEETVTYVNEAGKQVKTIKRYEKIENPIKGGRALVLDWKTKTFSTEGIPDSD